MPRTPPAPEGRTRAALPALALTMASALFLVSGCAGAGEPKSAGPTPAASAPKQLWTPRKPPPALPEPNAKLTDGVPSPVRGLPRVPSGDIHQVSALAVAKARLTTMTSPLDEEGTDQKIKDCKAIGQRPCPVQAPEYRDLNGDGKDELLLGVASGPYFLFLWAFTVKDGRVTVILDQAERPRWVKLSGRDVIVQEPADNGYDIRRVYSWDKREQAMDERTTEYVESSRK
ncbi:hypothetical protein IPZ61_16650 [Streptomyces sioyaensis]|uniref:hypothetical protein n=1 Tax=Streptomyces sioyaensis TaxID=67364 RepID=UPI001F1612CE|nr:hypothetical protein [Streptomyces sioyaensis]MCF3174941.1 hypothetical protein [Streptomyces sioyaensis]